MALSFNYKALYIYKIVENRLKIILKTFKKISKILLKKQKNFF